MGKFEDDELTDNTKIKKCKQCELCIMWRKSEVWENAYNKACCKAYPYPNHKPISIINNHGICPHRKVKS